MQQQPKRSQAPMGLIDGYLSTIMVGRVGPFGLAPHVLKAMEQLDRFPGRWGLIYANPKPGHEAAGMKENSFSKAGYEIARINGQTYARRPHPSGLPIEAFVTRLPQRTLVDSLPDIKRDTFKWSASELNKAAATAREWLFPIEGTQAA